MSGDPQRAAAIVGVGAILPDAPEAEVFWSNVRNGRYSVSDVDPGRWDPALYYDPDPQAPEKTYSKIGGWVREWQWDPLAWRLPVPPRVADAMDESQKWAVACTRMALTDAGWPERPLDSERTAVIIGNALSGEKHYLTALRITFPEVARALQDTHSFAALPADVRARVEAELRADFERWLPPITEDTMPGELGNCLAGRVANLFNLRGPNFTVDAACGSALAALEATFEGLVAHDFDVAVTGGIDRNMGAHTFVKFCAIGALSPSGTRPYADGADGFVMGEGAALFVVKRLADAIRDGDRIYAVVRGIGSASDGRGKGLTAPNPVGQRLAVARAWRAAGISPAECTLVEGHGTSTRVGDVVEVESLIDAFGGVELSPGAIALGSVKSNIGHLKAAAGAAGLLKASLALRDRVLPPSLGFDRPNPNIDWSASPFAVNTELRDWQVPAGRPRIAGVSAFGFGGTNFHVVLEEYMPTPLAPNGARGSRARSAEPTTAAAPSVVATAPASPLPPPPPVRSAATAQARPPLRGALVLGADTAVRLANDLRSVLAEARQGRHASPVPPAAEALRAAERIAIDHADGDELIAKAQAALGMLPNGSPAAWAALRARGIHRGAGMPGKVAFLYTGQGSQYANMLADLRAREAVVAEVFDEADTIMAPWLEGRRLSDIITADRTDEHAVAVAEEELRRTEITQPAVLTADIALTRLLAEYGITPDLVMGHSLGEYAALVAAGGLSFRDALEAVSARGHEMASLRVDDAGAMAAVAAPLDEVREIVAGIDGYVVLANINSDRQVVLGGGSDAVAKAVSLVRSRGYTAIPLAVSHAFHTEIVAPASRPLRAMLARLGLQPPRLPVVSNVTGELYPTGTGARDQILDLLAAQVASPVQFHKGLQTLYAEGARVFIESGPKHALQGFASDVLGDTEIVSLATNHPKQGDVPSFNSALCGAWAAGLGLGRETGAAPPGRPSRATGPAPRASDPAPTRAAGATPGDELEQLFAEFLERGRRLMSSPGREIDTEPLVITGAALGLPGARRLFDDGNIARLLAGEQGIDVVPARLRREMLDKHITRLVKRDDGGAGFEAIDRLEDVIKLAARAGEFDLHSEFGVDADRIAALGHDTQMAIAAGIDALRDAGIPLVLRYKTTTTGAQLPSHWELPAEMRDDTGVIFASAFPGLEEMADEVQRSTVDAMRRERLAALESLRARMLDHEGTDPVVLAEVERRIHDVTHQLAQEPYRFDRRFIFRVLSMGHSQFAELIGARGPNTQVNSACASTTQAVALAEDWIRLGRCRRVVVIAADDATSDTMLSWIGAGFLATGAAATDEVVDEAALPFDRRRHGMIVGMGAAGLVVESAASAAERGLTPICEVLASVTANSAFHGTRLDVEHISAVMEKLVAEAERHGVRREEIARELMFVSHETYTPARGGSAAAEIHALRAVFGADTDRIVIANSKGYTGHPMGVGLEDVLAVKSLETGVVPPVPNFREPDPELGALNLSQGGAYPIRYALRLAAGFGSQIAMLLLRWTPVADGRRRGVDELGYRYRVSDATAWQRWLRQISGQDAPRLEVVDRRLRIADQGAAPTPAPPPMATPPVEPPATPVPPPAAEPLAITASISEKSPNTPAPPPPAATDGVAQRVLEIVAEQTGYPQDLLDLDLDLEADLGIDTVKQAEMFATLREAYDIPRDDTLKLRDYPTLTHVIGFIHDRAPHTPAGAPTPAGADEDEDEDEDEDDNRFPRRVPVPVLRPPLDICADTGVTLTATSRILLMPDAGGAAAALTSALHNLGAEALTIEDAPDMDTDRLADRIAGWTQERPIDGVFWLAALDDEGDPAALDAAARRTALHTRVRLLAATMRALPETAFLIAATRLGGRHGYDAAGATSVLGGAVSGFTKALARERDHTLVKVVDFSAGAGPEDIAAMLITETHRDPGTVEVGHADDLRWSVGLIDEPAEPVEVAPLGAGDVVLVTGAAGSIVSHVIADLAAASGATFHLFDLAPAPDPADPDLVAFTSADPGQLKQDLAQRLRDRGDRPTPRLIEHELAKLERAQAALAAISAVEGAGGTARWHQVDLTDPHQVSAAVDRVLAESHQVDLLLHCAGVEVSHPLADKSQSEFDLVFDVKAHGWLNVLAAFAQRDVAPPARAVAFSSIAGRFGNAGQTDYAAANDLLCKSASHLQRRLGTRVTAIDWTAWADIGMASRGSIPQVMAAAGIEMLPPALGVGIVRRELSAQGAGEVLIAGSLGRLLADRHPAGGLDRQRAAAAVAGRRGPMTGALTHVSATGTLSIETELDPRRQAFLNDHRIDGTPVLPGVMGLEAFAEAAAALVPGFTVVELADVELEAPFKFYRDEPRTAVLHARIRDGGDGMLLADCEMVGRRSLPGQGERVTRHFTGRARLARSAPPPPQSVPVAGGDGGEVVTHDEVYRVYFHGPAYQVLERAWRRDGQIIGRLAGGLPADHEPPEQPEIFEPRLVELCFQTSGLWELGTTGRMALPTHINRVTRFAQPEAAAELWAVVTPHPHGADAEVVDERGRVRLRLEGYGTTELPGAIGAAALQPIRTAMADRPAG
ncbi:MAG TPA: SDR family NAD(P)-dependent oxidoreductase [Solirubrobacteraceae bacterium]|nr:SDR family NAD(P)-dependent oxidoreductase [Solirubrobacteraceae bacterium]